MEITSLNQLKIMGTAFEGLTMAHFQISTSHFLVRERKRQLPHPAAQTSLQEADTTQFRRIQVSLLLIHLPPGGPTVNTSVFAPQLTHQRENEIQRMLKDKIIKD